MFGAGDCEAKINGKFVATLTASFRPLMFGAGDCEAALAYPVPDAEVIVVSDPSCSGQGTARRHRPRVRGGHPPPRFRPLMFGAGDCETPPP